ncbi:MAG: hypothetical protein M3R44_03205, partial [Candidatus Eremiobacteraeota bacterium]|nr:hypothetical protein [Candidatus Eremiobacteraeota bacterium]
MSTSEAVTYRPNVLGGLDHTTKLRWKHGFDAYRVADDEMGGGSTLGSPSCQMVLKATGAIEKVFCVDAGCVLLKNFVVKHWDDRSRMKLDPLSGHFSMYPEHQEHRYMLTNGVQVQEDVFVLSRGPQDDGSVDPPLVYYAMAFTNQTREEQSIATYAFVQLSKGFKDELVVAYDPQLRALIAHSKDDEQQARIVGASRKPDDYEVSLDHGKAVTAEHPGSLSGNTDAPTGFAMGVLHYATVVGPGETQRLDFRLGVSAAGVDDVKKNYRGASSADA